MRYFSAILFFLIASLPYISMLGTNKDTAESVHGISETISILSPHRREVRLEYSRGFRKWMNTNYRRNVNIQWLDVGGTSKILKDLESRFATSPDSPGVDILFGGGVAPYYRAIKQGWLTPVSIHKETLESIPPLCAGTPVYDQNQQWFGVALSEFGILYNRPIIERMGMPIPSSWEILGRPEFTSWIASGDPRSSGSVHMCYEIILQAYGFKKGWNLITRICANVRRFGEGGGVAPREVASGEVAAGMVIDQYAQTVIDSIGNDALVFILPENATLISADPIAMLKGAPSPELSRLFIEYVLSKDGQRLLYQSAGNNGQRYSLHRLPVRKSLYEEPQAPKSQPYKYHGGFQYDTGMGSRRWRIVNDLIGTWLIDAHRDLVIAWKSIIRSGMNTNSVQQLCAVPITEIQMEKLLQHWNDPRYRLKTVNHWASEAKMRYQQLEIQNNLNNQDGKDNNQDTKHNN